nr:MBL fold metallo-hydrolase [Actibacterium sp. 188UL27-1]
MAEWLSPDLARITAPNPSPMTFRGTNTYLLGAQYIAVIDPGPMDAAHLQAIKEALKPSQQITHILVTHSHLDHSPLATLLAQETGAQIHAFGTHLDGRTSIMTQLAQTGRAHGGEGIDSHFRPDIRLPDGATITSPEWQVTAIWTPGHTANHMCFQWGDVIFSGDHVMGWATSLVSPPDGDLTAFMASCRKLQAYPARTYYPGHGEVIDDPKARLAELIDHRLMRETQILNTVSDRPTNIPSLTRQIYVDTDTALLRAAERNVFAHLIDLAGRGLVEPDGELSVQSHFRSTRKKSA